MEKENQRRGEICIPFWINHWIIFSRGHAPILSIKMCLVFVFVFVFVIVSCALCTAIYVEAAQRGWQSRTGDTFWNLEAKTELIAQSAHFCSKCVSLGISRIVIVMVSNCKITPSKIQNSLTMGRYKAVWAAIIISSQCWPISQAFHKEKCQIVLILQRCIEHIPPSAMRRQR